VITGDGDAKKRSGKSGRHLKGRQKRPRAVLAFVIVIVIVISFALADFGYCRRKMAVSLPVAHFRRFSVQRPKAEGF